MAAKSASDSTGDIVAQQYQHKLIGGGAIQAPRSKIQHGLNFLPRDRVLFDNFIDSHAVLQILEHNLYRSAGVAEGPSPADLAGNTLDGRTLFPINCCH